MSTEPVQTDVMSVSQVAHAKYVCLLNTVLHFMSVVHLPPPKLKVQHLKKYINVY
jgi:hypothetical protein